MSRSTPVSPAPAVSVPSPTLPDAAAGAHDAGDWFRTLVENAQDIVTVLAPEGRILYDSPSVSRLLGYAQGELVGRNALELVHPEDLPRALDLLIRTADAPGEVASLVFRFRHRDGHWRWLESVGSAARGPGLAGVVVTSREVGEREPPPPRERADPDSEVEILERLARAAELRDDETGSHTRRVGELAAALAAALDLPEHEVDLIRRAAPLHDVGKIGIPDSILLKQAPLTPPEMQVMRSHTTLGARILAEGRSELLRAAERIALSHHERWDGEGYPEGRIGEEIPLPARIVAVADFYDALTHHRVYRPAHPPARVVGWIREQRGAHFDPGVADAFAGLAPTLDER